MCPDVVGIDKEYKTDEDLWNIEYYKYQYYQYSEGFEEDLTLEIHIHVDMDMDKLASWFTSE